MRRNLSKYQRKRVTEKASTLNKRWPSKWMINVDRPRCVSLMIHLIFCYCKLPHTRVGRESSRGQREGDCACRRLRDSHIDRRCWLMGDAQYKGKIACTSHRRWRDCLATHVIGVKIAYITHTDSYKRHTQTVGSLESQANAASVQRNYIRNTNLAILKNNLMLNIRLTILKRNYLYSMAISQTTYIDM